MNKKDTDAEIKRLEETLKDQVEIIAEKNRIIELLKVKIRDIPAHISHGIVLGTDGPRVYGNEEAIKKVIAIIEKAKPKRRKAAPPVPPLDNAGDVD